MKKIVGIGEILWDMLPQGKQLGGAPANFAYHVCRLGGNGWSISAISTDPLGNEIKEILSTKNINTFLVEVSQPTGTVEVTLDEKGVPSYEIMNGVAWDFIPFTKDIEEIAKETEAVCYGTLAQRSEISRQTIFNFISAMPQSSVKVYDINLRQDYYSKEIITKSLDVATILKINDEELDIVAKLFNLEGDKTQMCRSLIEEYNLQLVILTKGSQGSDVITLDKCHSITPEDVQIVDTVGAGDAFTAAFVLNYLQGKSIEEAHEIAGKVSTYVCTKAGAMPE